ncbi:hypothetical protein VTO42DRAFT_5312 [Malbranchea cinnamomea]
MAKASKRTSTQKTASTTSLSSSPEDKSTELSAEFTQIPPSLREFVEPLSRKHIYLLHLDTQPRAIKRQIFLFPLFLNVLIVAVILYRIYAGSRTYPAIVFSLLDGKSSVGFDPSTASWTRIATAVGQRALIFLIDYLLLVIFLPWPIRFWTGPFRWRRKLGFQNVEVIVRQSREWSKEIQGPPRAWVRSAKGREILKERIIPAIMPVRLQTKTGFLMIDADWDLDFAAMIRAHEIVDSKEGGGSRRQRLEPFLPSVLVYGGDDSGWLVWRVEQADDDSSGSELSQAQRDKILEFKKKLTDMGKEDLFFRWIELVQFESTQPGGFTPERQRKAMLEVKELFEKEGVDFEKFWAEVGGMEGISL